LIYRKYPQAKSVKWPNQFTIISTVHQQETMVSIEPIKVVVTVCKAIADAKDLHYSTVSKIIKTYENSRFKT